MTLYDGMPPISREELDFEVPTMEALNSKVSSTTISPLDEAGNVSNNTRLGKEALPNIVSNGSQGYANTAIGEKALLKTTGSGAKHGTEPSGVENVAVGARSMEANEGGSFNTGVGRSALRFNVNGIQNVALGTNALEKNTTGSFNVGLGTEAMWFNKTGEHNVAIGRNALELSEEASFLIAIGDGALQKCNGGTGNCVVGSSSAKTVTTGSKNTVLGNNALELATTGSENTALGFRSLHNLTIGTKNLGVGYEALPVVTEGERNVGIGPSSGNSITTGKFNTAVGASSLLNVTTGEQNTAIGRESGLHATGASSGNVFIGRGAGPAVDEAISNKLYIHNSSNATPLLLGDFSTRELTLNVEKLSLFKGVAPVARAAEIAIPAETFPSQKLFNEAVKAALKNIGITL